MQKCIYDGCECLIRQYYKKEQATPNIIKIDNIIINSTENYAENDICSYFCAKHEDTQDAEKCFSNYCEKILTLIKEQITANKVAVRAISRCVSAIKLFNNLYYNSIILYKKHYNFREIALRKLREFIETYKNLQFILYYHHFTRRSNGVSFEDANAQKIYDICKSMYNYETDTYNYDSSSLYEIYKIDNRIILVEPVTKILQLYLNEIPNDEIAELYKLIYEKDLIFETFVFKRNKEIIKSKLNIFEPNDTTNKVKLLAALPYGNIILHKDLINKKYTFYENKTCLEDLVKSKYPTIKICTTDAEFDISVCGLVNNGKIQIYKKLPVLLENSYTSSFIYGPYYSSNNYVNIGLYTPLC